MEQNSWTVEVDGAQRAVKLDWTYYGGRRRVTLDGNVVGENTAPMRWRSEQAFEIGGHPAVVRTKPKKRMSPYFVISLEVDGSEVPQDPKRKSRWEA